MKAKTKTAPKFTAEERSAMRDRARELKSESDRAGSLAELLARIAEMQPSDRDMGGKLHEIITSSAPDLAPRLWYGMPAYYKDGKLICHFQPAEKFKTRYATLGFSDQAQIDDGTMWPVAYALPKLTAADEARISALVKQAVK